MIQYIVFFLIATASLFSEEDFISGLSSIQANSVSFEDLEIILKKEVSIAHTFGSLSCDEARIYLEQSTETKKKIPKTIVLKNAVEIELKDRSRISADQGEIDCTLLEGVFTADPEKKVLYVRYMEDDNRPINTTSKRIKITMEKQLVNEKASYVMQDIQAEGAVHIVYGQEKEEE